MHLVFIFIWQKQNNKTKHNKQKQERHMKSMLSKISCITIVKKKCSRLSFVALFFLGFLQSDKYHESCQCSLLH